MDQKHGQYFIVKDHTKNIKIGMMEYYEKMENIYIFMIKIMDDQSQKLYGITNLKKR